MYPYIYLSPPLKTDPLVYLQLLNTAHGTTQQTSTCLSSWDLHQTLPLPSYIYLTCLRPYHPLSELLQRSSCLPPLLALKSTHPSRPTCTYPLLNYFITHFLFLPFAAEATVQDERWLTVANCRSVLPGWVLWSPLPRTGIVTYSIHHRACVVQMQCVQRALHTQKSRFVGHRYPLPMCQERNSSWRVFLSSR